jgi:hypothetical protein
VAVVAELLILLAQDITAVLVVAPVTEPVEYFIMVEQELQAKETLADKDYTLVVLF